MPQIAGSALEEHATDLVTCICFFENYYLQTANWETHKQGTFMGRIARFPAPELVESLVSLLAR